MNPHTLTRTAHSILVADLEGHGNVLSEMHSAALLELVDTFTGYAAGTESGRKAFPLPTGMGKTSAVVAFIAAMHRLGCVVPVSVAASKVEALCTLKRDLVAHGVPVELIGLKHSVPDASEPSTGSASYPIQLVTHARVRSGRDFDLFGTHDGQDRALCIYDESLMRADAFAFSALSFYASVAVLNIMTATSKEPLLPALLDYLKDAEQRIRAAVASLQDAGDPYSNGTPVQLGELHPDTIEGFKDLIARFGAPIRGWEQNLRDLLTLSQDSLWVIGSEQGDGIVTAREAVPAALRNVVVLDASAPIRELMRLDPSITLVESFEMASLKSFEHVEVNQILSPGGRSTISYSLSADRREASAVVREVASIISEGWDKEAAFLVFTFTRRGSIDLVAELRRGLQRAGIDVAAKTPDGKDRVVFLTWGSETSLNGLEHCTSVIMAGVLHRAHLDLAAMVRGQTGNPAEPTPSARIRELVESEIAHCIYQGASRGSCRRSEGGKARAMRLHFIHRDPAIKTWLDRVMPGAVWSYPEPRYLVKQRADGKTARMLAALLQHLQTIPSGTDEVSSRKVKQALGLPKEKATEHAFTRAGDLLCMQTHGWMKLGRGFIRGAAAHGFEVAET
ncbi:hypothetical protein [Piscinibacterium candidicorallinum]|uniref:Uncharacterized protein n=1 Tax=Piscinibacterium candidicorallinum TaxID=1793872 RepID=A0ABV7GYV8_9BURK